MDTHYPEHNRIQEFLSVGWKVINANCQTKLLKQGDILDYGITISQSVLCIYQSNVLLFTNQIHFVCQLEILSVDYCGYWKLFDFNRSISLQFFLCYWCALTTLSRLTRNFQVNYGAQNGWLIMLKSCYPQINWRWKRELVSSSSII